MEGVNMTQRIPSDDEIMAFILGMDFGTEYDRALDELYKKVHPVPWRVNQFQVAATEYFLFEHEMECGMTPASLMAEYDQTLLHWSLSGYHRVVPVAPFTDVAHMKDIETGDVYEIRDATITSKPRWQHGSLGVRLCEIDGHYEVAGRVNLHDNADSVSGYSTYRITFANDLRMVIGDGGWEDTILQVS